MERSAGFDPILGPLVPYLPKRPIRHPRRVFSTGVTHGGPPPRRPRRALPLREILR